MVAGFVAVDASAQSEPQIAPEAASVAPDPMASAFQAFLLGLRSQANAAGVSNATFDRIVPTLRYNPRVISLDRAQPGGDPTQPATIPRFAPYKARHVDADRINRGRVRYQALRPQLARVERETGVPESIMMAIYGHETGYGSYMGNFDLLGSLATLAFEGRRRDLFTGELIAAMLLVERGVSRDQLKGSWAGATGLPQFLPSVYLRLARDGDGDGRAEIWGSEADALASIGNYLVNAGWKANVPWGVAVRVPANLDRAALTSRIVSPRCPRVHARHSKWKTIGEWRTLGIQIMGSNVPADSEMASLLEPDGPGATAYLLTGNYRVILDYNCSNFYGLSVGLLADAIVG
jgi:lytic murein transglycosylase